MGRTSIPSHIVITTMQLNEGCSHIQLPSINALLPHGDERVNRFHHMPLGMHE